MNYQIYRLHSEAHIQLLQIYSTSLSYLSFLKVLNLEYFLVYFYYPDVFDLVYR